MGWKKLSAMQKEKSAVRDAAEEAMKLAQKFERTLSEFTSQLKKLNTRGVRELEVYVEEALLAMEPGGKHMPSSDDVKAYLKKVDKEIEEAQEEWLKRRETSWKEPLKPGMHLKHPNMGVLEIKDIKDNSWGSKTVYMVSPKGSKNDVDIKHVNPKAGYKMMKDID